jgi:hypothetical protein
MRMDGLKNATSEGLGYVAFRSSFVASCQTGSSEEGSELISISVNGIHAAVDVV